MSNVLKTKKEKKSIFLKLKILAIVCLVTYAIIYFFSQQIQLTTKVDEISSLNDKISLAVQENDELQRLLKLAETDEYLRRVAIEKFGYAYENEVRIYVTAKK